ncbi:MAG: hypothetical protein ABTQ32_09300 [Myxococcaceae bacterium]
MRDFSSLPPRHSRELRFDTTPFEQARAVVDAFAAASQRRRLIGFARVVIGVGLGFGALTWLKAHPSARDELFSFLGAGRADLKEALLLSVALAPALLVGLPGLWRALLGDWPFVREVPDFLRTLKGVRSLKLSLFDGVMRGEGPFEDNELFLEVTLEHGAVVQLSVDASASVSRRTSFMANGAGVTRRTRTTRSSRRYVTAESVVPAGWKPGAAPAGLEVSVVNDVLCVELSLKDSQCSAEDLTRVFEAWRTLVG